MKARFSCALWPGLLAVVITCGTSQAEGPARSIEFSKPRSESANDDSSSSPSQSRIEQIESELSRPFQSFKPLNSMEGLIITPPHAAAPSVVPSRQVRELMERKRDWMYLKPEEIYSMKTVEETYKATEITADGRDRKNLSPLERYLLDQSGTDPGRTNLHLRSFDFGQNPYAGDAVAGGFYDNPKSGSVKQMEKNLRGLFGLDSSSDASEQVKSSAAADFFGFKNNANAASQPTTARRQQIEAFKQIYDFGNPQSAEAGPQTSKFSASTYGDSTFYDPPKAAAEHSTPAPGGNSGGFISSGATTFTPSLAPTSSPAPRPAPVSPFFSFPHN